MIPRWSTQFFGTGEPCGLVGIKEEQTRGDLLAKHFEGFQKGLASCGVEFSYPVPPKPRCRTEATPRAKTSAEVAISSARPWRPGAPTKKLSGDLSRTSTSKVGDQNKWTWLNRLIFNPVSCDPEINKIRSGELAWRFRRSWDIALWPRTSGSAGIPRDGGLGEGDANHAGLGNQTNSQQKLHWNRLMPSQNDASYFALFLIVQCKMMLPEKNITLQLRVVNRQFMSWHAQIECVPVEPL